MALWLVRAGRAGERENLALESNLVAIGWEEMKNAHLPVPPKSEAIAIAAFLDDKCAKVDEAVRIKEEQIALLRERRQILIQEAVTRGLNPDALMKDSGIDWVGEVPRHWDLTPLFAEAHIKSVTNRAGLPLLSVQRPHLRLDLGDEIVQPRQVRFGRLQPARRRPPPAALLDRRPMGKVRERETRTKRRMHAPEELPRGTALLQDPRHNKGTGFTEAERDALGLRGLLPPRVFTMDGQLQRVLRNLRVQHDDLEKYIFLVGLQDRNETLFYRLVIDHLTELMPIIYTPTVGEACRTFGHIYRRPRGLYLSVQDRGRIRDVLAKWHHADVAVIVATDGERILGLPRDPAPDRNLPFGEVLRARNGDH